MDINSLQEYRLLYLNWLKELLHQSADSDNVIISTGCGVPCHFNNMDVMNM